MKENKSWKQELEKIKHEIKREEEINYIYEIFAIIIHDQREHYYIIIYNEDK